jgi:hypothetical protein
MGKLLAALAVFGTTAAPALAQATPQPAPAQKAETVTKVVCERVRFEESTGSRLGPAPKKCKKVEVPAEGTNKKGHSGHAPSHSGHAH